MVNRSVLFYRLVLLLLLPQWSAAQWSDGDGGQLLIRDGLAVRQRQQRASS